MMIAANSKHAGDPKRDNRGYAEPMSREQLDELLSQTWLRKMVEHIREGNEKLKDRLPFLCPHYSEFQDNHRQQKCIIPDKFTYMTCVDVDDKEVVDAAIERALTLNSEEGDWHDMVMRIDYSARRKVHIWLRMPVGKTIEETQRAFCEAMDCGVKYDESCITPERFIYLTGKDEEIYRSPLWLEPIPEDELEERREAFLMRGLDVDGRPLKADDTQAEPATIRAESTTIQPAAYDNANPRTRYIFEQCMKEAEVKPSYLIDEGARHNSLKSVLSVGATQLLSKAELLGVLQVMMPQHWQDQNIQQLVNDFYEKYTDPSRRMTIFERKVFAESQRMGDDDNGNGNEEHSAPLSPREGLGVSLPLGASDSVAAVGQHLAMPVVTAICPCIGALATGVRLDVHGRKRGLNLIAYIAGDFASGKGDIDPVVNAWMSELKTVDKMYQQQEKEWRAKKRAAMNKKEQPEEPQLPRRYLTLNNTVANLAEQLENTEGKHAFSFTPEADTVAQKWKSSLSDFSVMLRQSYDGSEYEREARSADAANVHIDSLLWNVVMCGTPDALYRVVKNYTDGFQSRIAVASTPDNTFTPLDDKPCVLTDRQRDRIQQVAHLLPLMHGEVVLPKLEQRGREWLEKVRLDSMMNDDRTRARQRFRVCVTAQRMTCCLMLCKVCDQLIRKHGLTGAETQLKQYPNLWKEMLLKAQTPAMLEVYNVIADYLLDTALYYFRERIENAFQSRDYVGTGQRRYKGKNDSIYERLDVEFTFEQAMQQSIAIKGAGVTHNSVQQMLKNWRKQGLIQPADNDRLRKTSSMVIKSN